MRALVAATWTWTVGPGFTVPHEEAETFHLADTKNMF